MKPTLFLTRELPPIVMEKLHDYFQVTWNREDRILTKSELLAENNKEALLCLLTDQIDVDVIEANPSCKVISNYAVGYNNIDVSTASKYKIPVCITPGVLTETTADLAWALLMAVARRLIEADRYTREGKWNGWGPMLFLGNDIHSKTIGIIGMGRIGKAVARRAKGFGMRILYTSNKPEVDIDQEVDAERVELDELLQQSDFISLHCPFKPQTKHLIGRREIGLMKKTAILINTARGPIVDEKALLEALAGKSIAGAGLDVFEEEPKILKGICDLNNVVVAPHIGSATLETRTKMGILAVENAIAIFQGKEPHAIVNRAFLSPESQNN